MRFACEKNSGAGEKKIKSASCLRDVPIDVETCRGAPVAIFQCSQGAVEKTLPRGRLLQRMKTLQMSSPALRGLRTRS